MSQGLKIPHTGDKAYIDGCGQQHQYHSRVDQEYPKPEFLEKWKKSSKTQKLKKCLEICQNQRYALRPEVSNPSGSMISGWTKNTQKPKLFEKQKKIIQNAKTQKCLEICQNQRYTLRPEVSNPSESVVSTLLVRQNQLKKTIFCLFVDLRPFPNRNVPI